MPPAARVGDPGSPPHLPPNLGPGIGSTTIEINNKPAWRTLLDKHMCTCPIAPPAPAPHGPEMCPMGAMTVLFDNQMAVRMGDMLVGVGPPNTIMGGEPTVMIGDPGFGIADPANIQEFCADFKALMANWGNLTPEERKAELERIINKQLSKSGTPNVGVDSVPLDPSRSGELNFENWKLDINESLLNSNSMSPAQSSDLANTIFHEGRHAEQWFGVAQSQAAGGAGPAAISSATGLPANVASAAAANPLAANSSPNAVLGEATNRSVYGAGRPNRDGVLNKLSSDPADADNYQKYRALPEEQDAFKTGDATGGCC